MAAVTICSEFEAQKIKSSTLGTISPSICHRSAFKKKIMYFWLYWVFIASHGLSLVAASRGYSSLWCAGFSLRWLLLLQRIDLRYAGFSSCSPGLSSCSSRALERRLSSCGTWSQLVWGIWNLPRPGIEPLSPSSQGRFYPLCHQWSPIGLLLLNDSSLDYRSFLFVCFFSHLLTYIL